MLRLFTLLALFTTAAWAAEVRFAVSDRKGAPVTDAIVALVALDAPAPPAPSGDAPMLEIAQKNQEFSPYVSAVRVGTLVHLPNRDTVQHHVYSVSEAKKFEFPLYKPGRDESVMLDCAGTVVLGCNIHASMIAYIYVVDTPYFAKTDATGRATVDVPPGRYRAEIRHPRLPNLESSDLTAATAPLTAEFVVTLKPDLRIRKSTTGPASGYK